MPLRKMRMNPDIRGRRSIRLKGWDYTSLGWYFVTICAQNRQCLFGDIANGDMLLNDAGRNVKKCWQDIPEHFPHVTLDEFVIMPNHVHGIIFIAHSVGAYNHTPQKLDRPIRRRANIYSPLPDNPPLRSPSKTVGSIVRGFKIGVSEWFRKNSDMSAIWQRNYYEHIIRNEIELDQTRQYICANPATWPLDDENPEKQYPIKDEKKQDDICPCYSER
jgi:putative transposase